MIIKTNLRIAALALASACIASFGVAKTVEQASEEAQKRLEESVQAYTDEVNAIADLRSPLVAKMGELEARNIALRAKLAAYKAAISEGQVTQERHAKDIAELQSQIDYIHRSMDEYLGKFESRIQLAEDQRYKSRLTETRLKIDRGGQQTMELFKNLADVIGMGIERQQGIVGGEVFAGTAIDPDGNLLKGKVAVLGPSAFFSGDNDGLTGALRFRSGTIEPEIVPLDPVSTEGLVQLIKTNQGSAPLDPSLGDALSLDAANLTLVEHVRQGGVVGYFILFLGALALILSLLKLSDLNRFALADPSDLREIAKLSIDEGVEKGLERARAIPGVVGEMIQMGVRNIGASAVLLEEMMLSVVLKRRPEMERFLPFLAITAASTPLLGLLGTVVGMIKTFALITVFGTGDPRALSSGISEALVTTELGLVIAIPTLVLHGLFARMVKSRVSMLEQISFDFVKLTSEEEGAA